MKRIIIIITILLTYSFGYGQFDCSVVGENSGNDFSVQIYPNPFNDYLKIKGANNHEFVLKIVDVYGKIVIDKRLYHTS